jgi:hypothetical protein
MHDVNAIVGKHGGDCVYWGPIEPGAEPFADLFAEAVEGENEHDDEH